MLFIIKECLMCCQYSPPPPRKLNSTISCNEARNGFSLVELSIVLLIIGMLVSGVLVGRDMIRAAELRSITTQADQIYVSINLFKDKYMSLPGDMTNATEFWGAADGNDGLGNDCRDATSVGTTTCNGNDNDWLDGDAPPYSMALAHEAPEWFHSWVHLKNAGLIQGSYTGIRTQDPRQATPGVNIPQGKNGKVGFTLMSLINPDVLPLADWYKGNYKLVLVIGSESSGYESQAPAFSASEVWNIDKKVDDAMPGNGIIRTYVDNTDCLSSTNNADYMTATYNLTSSKQACAILYSYIDPGH